MPRYRFSWDVVPQPLLRRLARDLDLAGDAAGALAEVYGKRPSDTFVRDAWPTLRDSWLARDTATRRAVVAALRERGLGDVSLPVRNREQQLAYLASCRNAAALRSVVLGVFRELGEQAALQAAAATPAAPRRRRTRPPRDVRGLGTQIWDAWNDFERIFVAALESWTGGPLIIYLPEFYRPGDTWVRPWIRVTDEGDGRPTLVIVSGTPFALPPMIGAERDELLRDYGWVACPASPADVALDEAEPDVEWRYRLEVSPGSDGTLDFVEAVRMLVSTCIYVFDVLHPSFLEPVGFWGDKDTEIERVENGDRVRPNRAGYVTDPADRVIVYDIEDVEHLQQLVDIAISQRLGNPVSHDSDGDIPITIGGVTAYVRVAQDALMITAFCWLLTDVPGTGKTFRRLNQLNRRYRMGKLTWNDGCVTAAVDLMCWPFVPALVREAVDGLAAMIREVEIIHDRLGGDSL